MMLVLIDESGCPGFKLVKNSSPFFTIGMVIFSDLSEAESASTDIAKLRDELRIGNEFKFSKAHPKIKDKFFNVVCKRDFLVRALVADKQSVYSGNLRGNQETFYNYCMRLLLQHDDGLLKNAKIKIDGRGNRVFRAALKKYLQNHIGNQKIESLKFVDSKRDNLIQLADMTVGAISRANDSGRKDYDRWLNILKTKGKITNIWSFR